MNTYKCNYFGNRFHCDKQFINLEEEESKLCEISAQ